MKNIYLFTFVLIVTAILQSCGGTDTGNPAKNDAAAGASPCAEDEFVCGDGSKVKRNPADSCNFYPCP